MTGDAAIRASRDAVRDALASNFEEYEVRDRLHDVPPHEVYEVVVDGRRAVCKLGTGPTADPATEGRVLQHVDRETAVPVPAVLAVGRNHFVAEFCDDAPAEGAAFGVEKARAMGAGLATLHAETDFDEFGIPCAGSDALAVERHDSWYATVRAHLRDVRASLAGVGHADVADAVLDFLRDHPDVIAGAGDPVLCHGNYLPDHAAVDDGEVVRVLDFEHALVGPAEYDYWRTAMPTFDGPFRPGAGYEPSPAHEAFRSAYESVRPLPEGFDRRAPVYWTANGVSYLRALYVQNEVGPEERDLADGLAGHVRDGLDELREQFG